MVNWIAFMYSYCSIPPQNIPAPKEVWYCEAQANLEFFIDANRKWEQQSKLHLRTTRLLSLSQVSHSFLKFFISRKARTLCFVSDKPTYLGLFHNSAHMNSKQFKTGRTHPYVSDVLLLFNEWRSKESMKGFVPCIKLVWAGNKPNKEVYFSSALFLPKVKTL